MQDFKVQEFNVLKESIQKSIDIVFPKVTQQTDGNLLTPIKFLSHLDTIFNVEISRGLKLTDMQAKIVQSKID